MKCTVVKQSYCVKVSATPAITMSIRKKFSRCRKSQRSLNLVSFSTKYIFAEPTSYWFLEYSNDDTRTDLECAIDDTPAEVIAVSHEELFSCNGAIKARVFNARKNNSNLYGLRNDN